MDGIDGATPTPQNGGAQNPPSAGAAIPQGAVVGDPAHAGAGAAIPQGAVIGDGSQTNNSSQPDSLEGTSEDWGAMGNVTMGAVHGLASTAGGLVHAFQKVVPHLGLEPKPVVNHVADFLDRWSKPDTGIIGHDEASKVEAQVGYGGETLMEFILGDEAIKALPMAQRLEAASKIFKVAEGSPRIMKALQVGANMLAKGAVEGTRAGVVQGGQTLVRSGGDIKEAAKDAATTAATAGALGTATGTVAEALGGMGKTASKVKDLSEYAGNASTKEEVAKAISQRINDAETKLHTDYEAGVQDLNKRLGDEEINATDNPLVAKAKEILAEPNPEDHPTVGRTKEAAGDALDKKVKDLLKEYSTGIEPESKPETVEPSGLLDAQGNPIQPQAPLPKENPPYKINDLIQLRQTIRSMAEGYDRGDINSRALRRLLPAVDDTIQKLADQAGDQAAGKDYAALRNTYRSKINLFDEPVIQKLTDGKVDDAAKDFVGVLRNGTALPTAGKIRYNTDALRGIIGDDGVKEFGRQVFGTLMQDSVENGRFNPSKFIDTMKRVNGETLSDLFGFKDIDEKPNLNPGSLAEAQKSASLQTEAQSGLRKLYRDAQSAADLQHLTRLGLLTGAGAVAGSAMHPVGLGLGTLLGLSVAESGGSIAKGRELLNYVANHPAAWKTYEALGKTANSSAAKGAARVARGVAAQASPHIRSAAKNVYQTLAGSLSQ